MKILKRTFITLTLLAFLAIGLLFGLGYNAYTEAIENLPIEEVKDYLQDKVDDYTPLAEISPYLLKATIDVEDHRFYDRYGIDFIALARAMLRNILSFSVIEGGSTITQQLAQNIYFTFNSSLPEKMAEYYLLYDLENTYSKDEILEMYLNIIYYGDGYYGIHDAAMGYFDIKPIDLDLFDSTLLAGIPNAPSVYQLSSGKALALERQKHVINRMYEVGDIDAATRDELFKMQGELLQSE